MIVRRFDWAWLKEWNEGLIVLSGAQLGDLGQAILSRNTELATRRLQRCVVGFSRSVLILNYNGRIVRNEEDYTHAAVELAQMHQVPVVATNEVCFSTSDDF